MNKKQYTSLFIIVLMLGLGRQAFSQNRLGRGYNRAQTTDPYGYCLTGIELTAAQQTKVTQMQKDHQAAMTPLRTKMQGTRDWTVKNEVRAEMDALRAKHQEEIWTLVPEARNQSLNLRQGRGRGQGFGRGNGRGRCRRF